MGGTARLSFFCGLRSKAVHPGEFVLKPANPINQFGRRRHNGHLLASVVWLDEACLNVMILELRSPSWGSLRDLFLDVLRTCRFFAFCQH